MTLHSANEHANAKKPLDKAIILVGGWGTRLRPLTYTVPKPLVPFCNRPMLRYQLDKLVQAGVRTVVLAVSYHSDQIAAECAVYEREYGIEVVCSREERPLGTAGPLALAAPLLRGSSFFVMNSDICSGADLAEMAAAYAASPAVGLIMAHPVADPSRYGLVVADGARIVSFTEKPETLAGAGPWLINAGTYVFNDTVLDEIPLEEAALERTLFPRLAARGELEQYALHSFWMDIGQVPDYLVGQRLWLGADCEGCGVCLPGGTVRGPRMCARRNVVLGRGVEVGAGAVLSNCAVFDGARVGAGALLDGCVVGWECVVGAAARIGGDSALGRGAVVAAGAILVGARVPPGARVAVDGTWQVEPCAEECLEPAADPLCSASMNV